MFNNSQQLLFLIYYFHWIYADIKHQAYIFILCNIDNKLDGYVRPPQRIVRLRQQKDLQLCNYYNTWFINAYVLTKDKLSELKCKIDQATDKPDIIAISEVKPTKYRRTLSIEEYHINCYAIEHLNIIDSNKEKCMVLYLRDTLRYNVVTPTSNFEEVIIVQWNLINEPLILASIYRSPDSTIENNKSLKHLSTL